MSNTHTARTQALTARRHLEWLRPIRPADLVLRVCRSGKGLLAVSHLLGAWERRSVVCTHLKGELHAATAGWRARRIVWR